MHKSANSRNVGVLSTDTAENVEQVFDVRKGIDQLVNDFGKRIL